MIADKGWEGIGIGKGDVFTQATVLGALSCCGAIEQIEKGLSVIEAAANSDGGWGPCAGEPTTIESTALVLRAFVACGETRYIPYRSAAASAAALTARCEKLEAELAALSNDIDDRVTRRSREILADRNKIRGDVEKLREELRSARQENMALERTIVDRESYYVRALTTFRRQRDHVIPKAFILERMQSFLRPLIVTIAVVVINVVLADHFGLFGAGYLSSAFIKQMLAGALGLSIGAIGSLFLASIWWPAMLAETMTEIDYDRTPYLKLDGSSKINPFSPSVLALEFAEIASELPGAVSEELVYLLVTRIVDMPSDVGTGYSEKLLSRLDVPRDVQRRVVRWIGRLVSLDPHSRRAVIEQVRRQSLIP